VILSGLQQKVVGKNGRQSALVKSIQIVWARNLITRVEGKPQQELSFWLLVKNLAYEKQVVLQWAGEDNVWHDLPAEYAGVAGDGREMWRAHATLTLSAEAGLPGNILFSARYRAHGKDHFDHNHGKHHRLEADAGVWLHPEVAFHPLNTQSRLTPDQTTYTVKVAVAARAQAKAVWLHWTTDGWQTTQRTRCELRRDYWDHIRQSNARNPNQYGVSVWSGVLPIGAVHWVEYAVVCETATGEVWNNNAEQNFRIGRGEVSVLALNLHCYQEEDQVEKFALIARVINELEIDLVCLQEVGEKWNQGQGEWATNAAKVIRDQLKHPYELHTDWGHQGFGQYREGVAVLSRHPILKKAARYISRNHNVYDIHARKIVMAQVSVPGLGLVNVFSTHLSWWENGFREQYENLRAWANDLHRPGVQATFLCGDFNANAGGEGYALIAETRDYEDQFLKATARPLFDAVFRNGGNSQEQLADDGRIDFVFLNTGSPLRVTSARVLFTEDEYGLVSDHFGYYLTFEAT